MCIRDRSLPSDLLTGILEFDPLGITSVLQRIVEFVNPLFSPLLSRDGQRERLLHEFDLTRGNVTPGLQILELIPQFRQ